MEAIGKKIWAIAEGYIPPYGNGKEPQFTSHETACILNTNKTPANIQLTVYFSDKKPVTYHITVAAERTKHIRFNNLTHPQTIPKDTDYSSVFISDVPVVIQHSRLDSRQDKNALLSTVAFSQ